MKLTGKECKTFINKFTKLINGINKYNVESILLFQLYEDENGFEPVIESKPIEVDIFEYLKTIYSDNEIVNRSLTYMDMKKIKKKIDKLYYSPVLFASFNPIPLITITPDDLSKSPTSMILPSKFSVNSNYSNSYFVVTDLFKEFVKEKTITAIDDEMRFYDEDDCVYDTSAFIYKNEINKNFETKMVEETSPKHFFPIIIDEEDDSFINRTIRNLLSKLNIALINREMKDVLVTDSEIGIVSTEEAINELDEQIKTGQPFHLYDDSKTKSVLAFNEFFKINPKEVLFINKTRDVMIDNQKQTITYAGLVAKNKDMVIYLFYKYFDYKGE